MVSSVHSQTSFTTYRARENYLYYSTFMYNKSYKEIKKAKIGRKEEYDFKGSLKHTYHYNKKGLILQIDEDIYCQYDKKNRLILKTSLTNKEKDSFEYHKDEIKVYNKKGNENYKLDRVFKYKDNRLVSWEIYFQNLLGNPELVTEHKYFYSNDSIYLYSRDVFDHSEFKLYSLYTKKKISKKIYLYSNYSQLNMESDSLKFNLFDTYLVQRKRCLIETLDISRSGFGKLLLYNYNSDGTINVFIDLNQNKPIIYYKYFKR